MPDISGSILFLEDNGPESARKCQNQLQSLINRSNFDDVRGLVIGRFKQESKISRKVFTKIIRTKEKLLAIPVVDNVDFGHTVPMITFAVGGSCQPIGADGQNYNRNHKSLMSGMAIYQVVLYIESHGDTKASKAPPKNETLQSSRLGPGEGSTKETWIQRKQSPNSDVGSYIHIDKWTIMGKYNLIVVVFSVIRFLAASCGGRNTESNVKAPGDEAIRRFGQQHVAYASSPLAKR